MEIPLISPPSIFFQCKLAHLGLRFSCIFNLGLFVPIVVAFLRKSTQIPPPLDNFSRQYKGGFYRTGKELPQHNFLILFTYFKNLPASYY